MQPAEMPAHHKSPWMLVSLMLLALVVLESAAIGYVITNPRAVVPTPALSPAMDSTIIPASSAVPIVYVRPNSPSGPYGSKIFMVDASGKESLLLDLGTSFVARLVAVPQIGYSGVIYIQKAGEGGDDPYLHLYALNIATKKLSAVTLADQNVLFAAVQVSPDQTKLAYIPFDASKSPGVSPASKIQEYNLLTGKTMELGFVSEKAPVQTNGREGYSFAQVEENTIGGAGNFDFSWQSNTCVGAMIYSSPLADAMVTPATFCEK